MKLTDQEKKELQFTINTAIECVVAISVAFVIIYIIFKK